MIVLKVLHNADSVTEFFLRVEKFPLNKVFPNCNKLEGQIYSKLQDLTFLEWLPGNGKKQISNDIPAFFFEFYRYKKYKADNYFKYLNIFHRIRI